MPKVTIVSTLPFDLYEEKPGLTPGVYRIPAAKDSGISVVHIGDGYHHIVIPLSEAPPMKVIDRCDKIAQGLINDYQNSCLGVSLEFSESDGITQAIPGMFWVDEPLTDAQVKFKHKPEIDQAFKNTKAWFARLVQIADDDWQRYRQHKFISDLQRSASRFLGLEREWGKSLVANTPLVCWACKTPINAMSIVCMNCKAIINMEEYEKNKDRFAKIG